MPVTQGPQTTGSDPKATPWSTQGLTGGDSRTVLAYSVTLVSLLMVLALSMSAIWGPKGDTNAKDILGTVLPLLGTWVGTVLAFYFSKDNFLTAASINKQFSALERLSSIMIKDVMIKRPDVQAEVATNADAIKLSDALAFIEKNNKGNRYVVLAEGDKPLYVIHRSLIDKFISLVARGTRPPTLAADKTVADLTIRDLLDFEKDLEKSSFAVVREDATLAQAKEKMDLTPHCQDVFVTPSGTPHEPVRGWVTNGIVEKNLEA